MSNSVDSESKKDFKNISDEDRMNFFKMLKIGKDEKWANMMNWLETERGYEVVNLWEPAQIPNKAEGDSQVPRAVLYPPHEGTPRGAMIICAGGAFLFKSDNEAWPVADYFYNKGFYTVILDYRVTPYVAEDAGCDGNRAIQYLRANAERLNIDPNHISIGGFSAGGMLSNQAATKWNLGNPDATDPLEKFSSRPDAAILCYGTSMATNNLGFLGFDFATQNELARKSPDALLTPDCPPYFLFQTTSDDPRNLALMQYRLACLGIPFEAHTFEGGNHGNGLYDGKNEVEDVPHTAHWAELCAEWLVGRGFHNKYKISEKSLRFVKKNA